MKKNLILKFVVVVATMLSLRGNSQTLIFSEGWASSSFTTNGWTFPNGAGNWQVGSSYTPNGGSAPNAFFDWSPSMTNYSISLLSTTINATAFAGQNITLDYLLQLNNFSTSTLEEFKVEYKDVASSTWILANSYNNTVSGVQDWSVTSVPLTGMGGQNFEIRFTAFGVNSFNINGWGLDSIMVYAVPCPTAMPALTVTPTNTSICAGSMINLTASGPLSFTWQPGNLNGSAIAVSPTASVIYTVSGSMGSCTLAPSSTTVGITVNTLPSLTVSGTASVCQGQSSTLTVAGASVYAWSPAGSLNTSSGSSVIASPTISTLYSVIGTDSNGCSDSTTINLNVQQQPTFMSLSASPSIACSGGSVQLTANAILAGSYSVTSITYSVIPTPTIGVVTLCSAGTASVPLTNGNLDDGDWESISIPFSFQFFGANYNSITIGTNGFIFPGASAPNTYNGYGTVFPDAFSTTPCIAPIYSDLYFQNTGDINYFIDGVAPNRKLVVNWNGEYFSSTGSLTVQAIVYETSNIIEVHTTGATGDNSEILGIQDGSATYFYTAPGRNGTNYVVTTPDAYRFAPVTGSASYSWTPATFLSSTNISNPVANNVTAPTLYTVTATIAGCSNSDTLNLNTGITPTVTAIATPSTLCSGAGTVSISANGASTYSWSTGATSSSVSVSPSVTTMYSVVGTNTTGCSVTVTVNIPVGTTPSVTASASTGTICEGASTGLTAGGAATYTWNTGATGSVIAVTPTISTTYTVTGDGGTGCINTATVDVTVNALPSVSLSVGSTTACINGSTIALTGSPAGGAYTGTNVTTGVFTPGATAGTFTPSYNVTNTVTGCSNSASVTIIVSTCTGLDKQGSALNGLSVYPNPNSGEFTVELENGLNKTIDLTDITGRVILTESTVNDKLNVNINTLSNGVYFVKVKSNNSVEIIKLIKQ